MTVSHRTRRQRLGTILAITIALLSAACVTGPAPRAPLSPGERLYEQQEPTFSLRYAEEWAIKDPGVGEYVHVAAAKGAPNIIVARSMSPLSPDAAQIAQQNFRALKASQGFRHGEIAYARTVALADGTPAYESLIKWRHPLYRVQIATLYLLTEKNGEALKLIATDLGEDLSEQHRGWCYSLRME